MAPNIANLQSSDHDHTTVTSSTNPVLYTKRDSMPTMPPDEAARLPTPSFKRPRTKATLPQPPKRKPKPAVTQTTTAKKKPAGMTSFERDHPNAELPAAQKRVKDWEDWADAELPPAKKQRTTFERDHPNADLLAEQQRLEDWADATPPPAKIPTTARRGFQELDANNLNAGSKNQKTESKITIRSHALDTLGSSHAGIPTTTLDSPSWPSTRPKFAADTSASRNEISPEQWDEYNILITEASQCTHPRLTSNGTCLSCKYTAASLRLQPKPGTLSSRSPKCGDFPHCSQVPGNAKCYFCAFLALDAKLDTDEEFKAREKIKMKEERKARRARRRELELRERKEALRGVPRNWVWDGRWEQTR